MSLFLVQCDRSTCKKHACNAAIPVACTVKKNARLSISCLQIACPQAN